MDPLAELTLRAYVLIAVPAGLVCAWLWYALPASDARLLPPQRTRLMPWTGLELGLVLVAYILWPGIMYEVLKERLGPPTDTEKILRTSLANILAFPFLLATVLFILRQLAEVRLYQLGVSCHRAGADIFLGWLGFALVAPPIYILHLGVEWLCRWLGSEPEPHVLLQMMQGRDPLLEWVIFLTQAVLVAAVAEEFLFRGLIQRWLAQQPGFHGWRAVVASALLFALLHQWPTQIALFPLGLALGWLSQRTQSLIPATVLHALFNGVSCLAHGLSE